MCWNSHSFCDMQGKCNTKPSSEALGLTGSAPLTDWRPGQCVIVTDVTAFDVQKTIWLDSLYIRHQNTFRTDPSSVIWCDSKDCLLWMTNVTLQGGDNADPHSLRVIAGQMYAKGMPKIGFPSMSCILNKCMRTLNKCMRALKVSSDLFPFCPSRYRRLQTLLQTRCAVHKNISGNNQETTNERVLVFCAVTEELAALTAPVVQACT